MNIQLQNTCVQNKFWCIRNKYTVVLVYSVRTDQRVILYFFSSTFSSSYTLPVALVPWTHASLRTTMQQHWNVDKIINLSDKTDTLLQQTLTLLQQTLLPTVWQTMILTLWKLNNSDSYFSLSAINSFQVSSSCCCRLWTSSSFLKTNM